MDFEGLKNLMRENGIIGCGGAGFPSYAKLNQQVDTVIINCAECEPLLRLHRQLIEKKAYEVLETAELIAKTIGAKQVIVGLKVAYTKAIAALEANIANFPLAKICTFKEIYPAGDEVILIYNTTGRIVKPGALPASVGVVVYNVETVYNVYRALKGKPVTHKFVTITGEVNDPRTFYAPIGSKIYGLVKRCKAAAIEDPEFLIGGPMMGRLGTDQDVVTKTTNAVILLDKNHPVSLRKRTKVSIDVKRAMAACCQCHYCTDMCPRHLLGYPIDPASLMRVVSNQDSHNITPYLNAFYCSSCGVCEMYACHQGLSPRALLNSVKNQLRAAGIKPAQFEQTPVPIKDGELKRVPLARLRSRLDLEKYNHSAPMYDDPINAKEVVILLNQHIGAPAISIVKVNDIVKEGDLIAKAKEDALSVNYHASIDGIITDVTDRYITIHK